MLPLRSIAFMTFILAGIFSLSAVFGVIVLPTFLPIVTPPKENIEASLNATDPEPTQNRSAHLLFVGDIMLARGVEWQIGKHGLTYPWDEITHALSAPDLTVGNFEGTIRPTPHQELDGFLFDTTPAIAQTLFTAGIDLVSLSNNHSDNYGADALAFTRDTLSHLNITPFGDPYNSKDFVIHKTINNIPFAFIGFHAFNEDPHSILSTITSEKDAGNFVIVFPHWGNEYQSTPSPAQNEAAHMFIDAGANAIIGAHPHVIQTYENYQGVPIIYSLGNFLFDQDWSTATQQGLMLDILVDETSITMSFIPISVIQSHISLMDIEPAAMVLSEHNLPLVLTIPR